MKNRKYYSVILIILLISVMALAQESTTVNGILANYTELNTSRIFRIYDNSLNEILLSEDGLYLSHVNGGINEIKISSTSTQFSQQIDMQGNNIINCNNCDTPDNEKVNKSGDNMTGSLWNNDTSAYWFRSQTGYNQTVMGYSASVFCCGVTRITRSVGTGNNTGLVSLGQYYYNSTTILSNNDGGSISFLFHEPNPDLPVNFNAGKFGISWENKTANTTSIDFNPRTGVSDTANNIPAVRFLGSGGMTILTGTINISTLPGSGYRYLCIDDSEKVIQSSVACDLI